MELRERIKWARENTKTGPMTQKQLAEKLGWGGQSRLANYENEKNPREPTLNHIRQIADACGVRHAWLMAEDGDPFPAGEDYPGILDRLDKADQFDEQSLLALQLMTDALSELIPGAAAALASRLKESMKRRLDQGRSVLLLEALAGAAAGSRQGAAPAGPGGEPRSSSGRSTQKSSR